MAEDLKLFIAFLQTYQIPGGGTLEEVLRQDEASIPLILALFGTTDQAQALELFESVVRERKLPPAEKSLLKGQIQILHILMHNFQRRGVYTECDIFLQQLRDMDAKNTIGHMFAGYDPRNAAHYRDLIAQMRQATGGRIGLIRANQLSPNKREQLNAFRQTYKDNAERGLAQRSVLASSSEDSEESLELRQLY